MKSLYAFIMCLFSLTSCLDVMDIKPVDKVTSEALFSSEEGIRSFLANLYFRAPIEDHSFTRMGLHQLGSVNHGGVTPEMQTDNAICSEFNHLMDISNDFKWWQYGYIRDVNYLLEAIPTISILDEKQKEEMTGEARFLRAFGYFGLVKRYGGVPLIDKCQEYTSDFESLKVPRATEQATWDFVIEECEAAAELLPESRSGNDSRRATKWTAWALESRAALHAASIAKYGFRLPLEGPAVDQGLVGIPVSEADRYYETCINASKKIMDGGKYSLYKPSPASPEEAIENLMAMFQDPNIAPEEMIMTFGYERPGNGHSADFWHSPSQTADGALYPGRMNPTLDLVDCYESYSHPGQDAPIVTTRDGDTSDYNGYNAGTEYLHFENAYDIFKDKDARLWATVVLPFTEWKGQTIRIQAGYIEPNGTPVIEADKASIEVNGKVYHTFGADSWSDYSGFDQAQLTRMTRTGFSYKKFLSPKKVENNGLPGACTQDWAEFRYAEILLNYAEAVVESSTAESEKGRAESALNATRFRAGHTVKIPLTVENVQRERRVELAFENKRRWDLLRRREFHSVFDHKTATALLPVLDLREDPPSYIFIRKYAIRAIPLTFNRQWYYLAIPGTTNNGLIQNPQY